MGKQKIPINLIDIQKDIFGEIRNNYNCNDLNSLIINGSKQLDLLIDKIENNDDFKYLERTFDMYLLRDIVGFLKSIEVTKNTETDDFLDRIQKNGFSCKVFDNERELIEYICIDGRDTEQILDSIFDALENGKKNIYNNVFKINDKFVYVSE